MDLTPQQMMRLVQLNLKDRALQANTMWLCASCETCTTRCPMKVGVAEVMDALRRIAAEEGVKAPDEARTMEVFHREFLNAIRRWGRLNEAELIGMYKLSTGKLLDDVGLGIRLFGKQKLRPWHLARVKNTRQLAKLFEAALAEDDH
jgi:heterodisulfide reductase subunit C